MGSFGQHEDIDATASEWVVRLNGSPLGEAERAAFRQWLGASPAHADAFSRASALWEELAGLAAGDRPAERGIDAGPPAARPRPWWRASGRGAAAGAVLAMGLAVLAVIGNPLPWLAADARTAVGETRRVTLPDSSTIELGSGSAIAERFSAAERRVELLAGEIYVTAAPMGQQEARPFVVEAAGGSARALGTQFMVRRQDGTVTVTVAEHKVEVALARPADAATAPVVERSVLSPGQSVAYSAADGLGPVAAADLGRATAWRRGRLIFDRVPLADMLSELGRYRRDRIVVADSALARRAVSGVFQTDDLDGALTAVARELGARTLSLPPFLTVVY